MSFLNLFGKKKKRLKDLAAPTPPRGAPSNPEPTPPPPPPSHRRKKAAQEPKPIPKPIHISELSKKPRHTVPPIPKPPAARKAELDEIHESELESQTRKELHKSVPVPDKHPRKKPIAPPKRKSPADIKVNQFITSRPSTPPSPVRRKHVRKKVSPADARAAKTVEQLLKTVPKHKKAAKHTKHPHHVKKAVHPKSPVKHEEHFHGKLFHLHGGKTLRNTSDLLLALDTMSKDTFNHHVNNDKNDFSLWIRDVFHESALADRVAITRTPLQLKRALESHGVARPELKRPVKPVKKKVVAHRATSREISYKDEITRLRAELEHMRKALTQEIASGIEVLEQEREHHDKVAGDLEDREHELDEREMQLEEKQKQLRKLETQINERASHVDLAISLDEREKNIFKREQEAGSVMQSLEAEKKRFDSERASAEKLIREAVELRKEFKTRDQKAIAAQRALAEHEAQLASQRKELELLDHAIAERRTALKEHERLIREHEVPHYRQDHLDIGNVQPMPRVQSPHAEQLLATVQQIRNMLVAGRLDDAKSSYAVLRETFYEAQMSDEERHQVYNLIRELYADIELSQMDRQQG